MNENVDKSTGRQSSVFLHLYLTFSEATSTKERTEKALLTDANSYQIHILKTGGEKRKKDKSEYCQSVNEPLIPTLIFFALSQSINNALATLFVFFIIQPALST